MELATPEQTRVGVKTKTRQTYVCEVGWNSGNTPLCEKHSGLFSSLQPLPRKLSVNNFCSTLISTKAKAKDFKRKNKRRAIK